MGSKYDFSDPIDPKQFSTYDEYLERLKLQEEFQKKSGKIKKAFVESGVDEELTKNMEAIGFTYFDDDEES